VKRSQLAAALGVNERMVSYLLADLRAAGRLTTAPARDGFTVASLAINCADEPCNRSDLAIAHEGPALPIVTPESGPEVEQANKEGRSLPPEICGVSDLPCPDLPDGPEPARPSLAELVTEAYDSYPLRGPAKFKAIVAHVGPGYTTDEIRAAYEAEKDRRHWAGYDKKAREIAGQLADLSNKELAARIRSAAIGLDLASAPLPTLRADELPEKLAARIVAHQRAYAARGLYRLTHRLAIAERDRRERAADRQLRLLEQSGAAISPAAYGVDHAALDRTIAAAAAAAPAHKQVVIDETPAPAARPASAARLSPAEYQRALDERIRQRLAAAPALANCAD
jgi:hypothetical protein